MSTPSSSSAPRYSLWIELDPAASSAPETYTPQDLFEHLPTHAAITHFEPGWEVQGKLKQKHRRRQQPSISELTTTVVGAEASTSTSPKAARDWRFGPVRVDWFDFTMPDRDREKTFTLTTAPPESGSTSLPSGTLHLFRHPTAPPLPSDDPTDGPLLGILALPQYFTPSDLLDFLSALLSPSTNALAHIRVLRDAFPDRSLVLLKFRPGDEASACAASFTQAHNGRPFQDASPEVCRIISIDSVLITPTPSSQPPEAHPPPPRQILTGLELPTCPVCLDRMDSALTGLITVPCTHTFHCTCLSRWPDSRCPVCRASTAPSLHPLREGDLSLLPLSLSQNGLSQETDLSRAGAPAGSHCALCPTTTSLWICLICGNLGCGRYSQAHASQHYQSSGHAFALELETQRVWDYAGDAYVHRLIRNRADGKVVELPSGPIAGPADGGQDGGGGEEKEKGKGKGPGEEDAQVAEKMEAMGVEYGLLLSAQLETQRTWYEERIGEVERRLGEVLALQERVPAAAEGSGSREEGKRLEEERAGRERAERRAGQAQELARTLQRELAAERAVSQGLMDNLALARKREEEHAREKGEWEKRMSEMEDQLRDVMIFLEAREKIESGQIAVEGVQGGSVELPPQPPTPGQGESTPSRNGGGKKKKTPRK